MKRRVPKPLHDQVVALTSAIAQSNDPAAMRKARTGLMALFHRHQQAGTPDPFLTEAVASATEDREEAARLYRLAIEQCVGFPGEPLHSKRCGLIEALIELRETVEAREELAHARRAAFAAGDAAAIQRLAALEKLNVV